MPIASDESPQRRGSCSAPFKLSKASADSSAGALEESDGDFEKAVEYLRVTGVAKAAKRGSERTASNGLVAAAEGAMIELNSETDFVAKNEKFIALAEKVADAAAAASADSVESVLAAAAGDQTVEQLISDEAAILGENAAQIFRLGP